MIKGEDFEGVERVEREIQEIKDGQYVADVVGAFVTFETQLHMRNAIKIYNEEIIIRDSFEKVGLKIEQA